MATSSSSNASSSAARLQAHAELWNLTFSYTKSVALETAVSLGIPTAIHRLGGAASPQDLLASNVVSLPEHKQPYFPRLMRFLAATGVVALDDDDDVVVPNNPAAAAAEGEQGGGDEAAETAPGAAGVCRYRLTPVSRLLVVDDGGVGSDVVNTCATARSSLVPFVLSQVTRYHVMSSLHLSAWFIKGDDGAGGDGTPFEMAHAGMGLWDAMGQDRRFGEVFNAGMASDSQFVMESVIATCGDDVFGGITSLVDVGGGTGTAARAIARAFPHVACSVLDLPSVINGIIIQQPPSDSGDDTAVTTTGVEYIAGDMMSSIPPADAVLLKYVLHDWNDEDCVRILTQCKKAVCSREREGGAAGGGKVIIIDVMVGSPSSSNNNNNKIMFEAQATLDLLMMVMAGGKERDEHEWNRMFMDAGFKHYKARPAVGFLSVIELYPQ